MANHFVRLKLIIFMFISVLLSTSCGNYRHKVVPSNNPSKIRKIERYSNGRAYSNKKIERLYFLHSGDSIYRILTRKYDIPIYPGKDPRKYEAWLSNTANKSTFTVDVELIDQVQDLKYKHQDSIFKFMEANPKGKIHNKKLEKKNMYQTHIYLEFQEKVTTGSIELTDAMIKDANLYCYKSRKGLIVLSSAGGVFVGFIALVFQQLNRYVP